MNRYQQQTDSTTERLAVALGWFSVALGAAELIAPGRVSRLIGIDDRPFHTNMLRSYGVREIATGIGILSDPSNASLLWSRVGGDALDLATLGAAAPRTAENGRLSFATAAVLGVTLLDIVCARRLDRSQEFNQFGVPSGSEQAVTVRAPLELAEAGWVDWCASGSSRLDNNYAVRFEPAPGARGTEVRLSGSATKGTLRDELRRFKQLLETGEIPVSDDGGFRRPARPSGEPERANTGTGVER
jgi:hypothetical protein